MSPKLVLLTKTAQLYSFNSKLMQTYVTIIYKKVPNTGYTKLVGVYSTKELADEAGIKAVEKKGDSFWYTVTNKRLDHYEDSLV